MSFKKKQAKTCIIKTKVLHPQSYLTLNRFGFPILALCFFFASKHLKNCLAFQSFVWCLMKVITESRLVYTKYDIYVFIAICFYLYIACNTQKTPHNSLL